MSAEHNLAHHGTDTEWQDSHSDNTELEESYSDPDADPALLYYTEVDLAYRRAMGYEFIPDDGPRGGVWIETHSHWSGTGARGVVFEDTDGELE